VAELVRKYSDYLPPQGVRDLAKTAFAPPLPISESDQDSTAPTSNRPTTRSKTRHHSLGKKASYSDFEQGYAANIAPRYLTHYRRPQGRAHQGSRIPGPVFSPTESVGSSRRHSPDKRIISGPAHMESGSGRGHVSAVRPAAVPGTKNTRVKTPLRNPKEKSTTRPSPGTTRTHRRQPGPGTKVSNITKHFERISRENERANRRYAVIRGKRARPVASARAKVEVLESVKDAIKDDESDSSDASSQADDEGDGFDERAQPDHKLFSTPPSKPPVVPKVVLDSPVDVPEAASPQAPMEIQAEPVGTKASDAALTPPLDANHETQTQPPSPFLHPAPPPSFTPPGPEEDASSPVPAGTPSLFQALGNWLQQNHTDVDDSLVHIFRDPLTVVRTDEPTSIIAFALK
jgi:1-phosphatidylinositol-3-phosphate 5-kinase